MALSGAHMREIDLHLRLLTDLSYPPRLRLDSDYVGQSTIAPPFLPPPLSETPPSPPDPPNSTTGAHAPTHQELNPLPEGVDENSTEGSDTSAEHMKDPEVPILKTGPEPGQSNDDPVPFYQGVRTGVVVNGKVTYFLKHQAKTAVSAPPTLKRKQQAEDGVTPPSAAKKPKLSDGKPKRKKKYKRTVAAEAQAKPYSDEWNENQKKSRGTFDLSSGSYSCETIP